MVSSMVETEIKLVCKDMTTYQIQFPFRSPSSLNYSKSVGDGSLGVSGKRRDAPKEVHLYSANLSYFCC